MGHTIPTAVANEAQRGGFTPIFAGRDNGAFIYRAVSPNDGADTPTGLPLFLSFKDGKVAWISGLDALDLLARLS